MKKSALLLISLLFTALMFFNGCGGSSGGGSDSGYGIKLLRTSASPGSMLSPNDSIEVTLITEGEPETAKYSIDGTEPKSSGIDFNSGDKITIPLSSDSEKVLKIYVKNGNNEVTNSYYYQKGTITGQISDFNEIRMYQIMVESFIDGKSGGYTSGYGPSTHKGDIKGVISALDYIKSLNVNAIWLTPIFASNSTDEKLRPTGYFPDDYFNLDPNFGTNEEFRQLVNEAHKRGIYVFLDGVFGHHGLADIEGVENGPAQGDGGYTTKFPGSLDFYKEVANYWIENYEIDGWRLDQAYQLYQDGHSYWKEIRESIEATCAQRKAEGNQWGTLGYMVGEIWAWHNQIKEQGYGTESSKGLPSCFDFPTRYRIVQVLATQEDTSSGEATGQPASRLNEILNEIKSQYPSFAKPNFMITNHDVVRFGDLIQRASGLGYGTENPDYWARHRAAFSFMAQYTGPVTLYYGDEIGEEVEGFINNKDGGYYNDHVSRSQGRISGFNADETALKNYISALWKFRSENPALWNGTRKNIAATTSVFADYKISGSNKIVYLLNTSTSSKSVTVPVSSVDNASNLTKESTVTVQKLYLQAVVIFI